ncbi:MAG: transposase, partial [Erysipelotrichaceae bacterium]|nr:transposase [Erysipelotrichaceae bacterium]
EKIYISYDSTNKNCQAGDIDIVEFGHPKMDLGLPVFNYSIAYDTENQEPLFYEKYPGSINDISQLEFLLDKAYGYGYRHIGFILDRGYFSKQNLEKMDSLGYSFVIMIKGMASLVNSIVLEYSGTFEKKRRCYIDEYEVYGMTVKQRLYVTDEKERYIHIYHNVQKESSERSLLEKQLRQMKSAMDKHVGEAKQFGSGFEKYYILHYNEKTGQFQFAEEKVSVIEEELSLCGYFCIVTSEPMTAKEAINLYKSRDGSEKLFRGDKSYLGDKSMRVHTEERIDSKIFVEFIALIVRNRIYSCLKEKMKAMDKKPNFMTVPAALKELEKIEMVRLTDNVYHLDHAVTATQKTVLEAFGLNVQNVKYRASEISKALA